MSFRFITAVLSAGALVAALSAAPARAADPEDVGKFLGAAATLFIIGKIIQNQNENRDRDRAQTVVPQRHYPAPNPPRAVAPRHERHTRDRGHDRGRDRWQDRGRDHGARRSELPSQCLIPVAPGSGTRYVMGARCLDSNFRGARRLPDSCKVTLDGRHHDRTAYSVRCLRGRGFEVAGR